MEQMPDLYAYLLLRGDLPSLGRGKAQAHAMHAGNQMTHDLWVRPLLERVDVDPRVPAWHAQGSGFGTTISLGRAGQVTGATLASVTDAARRLGFLAGVVHDPQYPYQVDDETMRVVDPRHHTREPKRVRDGWLLCRAEDTAAWVMGEKAGLEVLLARFDLAPND